MQEQLRTFLERREFEFNEELHALLTRERRLCVVPEDGLQSGSGWLLQEADTEAGEWNLARAFGTPDAYLPMIEQLPAERGYHLLVPDAHETVLPECLHARIKDRLHWYRDDCDIEPEGGAGQGTAAAMMPGEPVPPGFSLMWREAVEPTGADWHLHAYLMHENAIAALVRPVRVTPHTVEVYVETLPHLRERGLATWLVNAYRLRLRETRRCLLYVVSSENTPSLRVAARLGLTCYQTLLRIPTSE